LKIVIIGAGTLGTNLAEYLNRLEHQVSIIERDSALLGEVASRLDVLAVEGSGASPKTLEEAGIRQADILIAVTPSDETNLLACNFAMQYGVPKRIARLVSDDYTQANSRISLATLGPTHVIDAEKELVGYILQFVDLPGVLDTAQFHDDDIYLRAYRISEDMPIAGKTLIELREMSGNEPVLLVAIVRGDASIIPSGGERLLPGDMTIAMMPKESFDTYRRLINRPATRKRKIVVSGDSLAAIDIAAALTERSERVILVDPDAAHGRTAAARLSDVEVLHGDCTDSDMLREIHMKSVDFFIAAGRDMEDNIMSSLLAKAEGAAETIAVRNDERHTEFFHSMGIDHVINPRAIALQRIVENIQVIPAGALQRLKKVDLDVVRIVVSSNSPAVGKTLAQLDAHFRKELIVGALMRNEKVVIPRGDTRIENGDEVLILGRRRSLSMVNKIFKAGLRV
jgi:trk system potassium uptake protein TrkA